MTYISSSPSASRSLLDRVRQAMGPRRTKKVVEELQDDISTMSLVDIRQQISIPIPEQSNDCDEKARLHKAAYHLVRQDRWDTLGELIRDHDRERKLTAGGTSTASVLSAGARKDLSDTIAMGLSPRSETGLTAATSGVEMLDQVLIDHSEDYGVALVVAQAHMDLGSVWRGQGWADEVPASDWKKFARHYRRAYSILEQFDPIENDSPALAAARCRTLAGMPDAAQRSIAYYEELIDLAPYYAKSYRQFGKSLLPRWYGTYELIEQQARKLAKETAEHWGDAAYALTYMDAAVEDKEALGFVDVAMFLKGLNDYLEAVPDQGNANRIAAYLSVSLVPKGPLVSGSKRALQNRKTLIAAAPQFVRDHMREVHPIIWAEAAGAHDPDAPPAKAWRQRQTGLEEAFSSLSRAFEREILRGMHLFFKKDGVDIHAV